MPSIEGRPLPRGALSSVRLRPWNDLAAGLPRCRLSTPLHPRKSRDLTRTRSPFTDPAAGKVALLWTWASPDDFCNRTRYAGTPASSRSSRASGVLAPLPTGTNRCRLRWPTDASPHRRPASHDLHAAACARRAPLAWTRQIVGPKCPREGRRAVGRTLRVPFSERFVHPGRPHDSPRSLDRSAPHRAGQDPSGRRSLAKGCVLG